MAAVAVEDVRVRHVRVSNNTDEVWTDRYDGVPVTLQPGESDTLPLDMALHFFGYSPGVELTAMLMHIATRMARTDGDWGSIRADPALRRRVAERFFEKFKIEPVTYKLVETMPAASEAPVPAIADEDDDAIREPSSVKDRAKAGMKDPGAEQATAPGRGHPRRDEHGRRRE